MKLVKENRRLHILRSLRREQYSQVEIDHLFKSLSCTEFYILPFRVWSVWITFEYYITVCWIAATSTALFLLQFLLRIFYIDRTANLKAIIFVDNHPLGSYLRPTKENKYNLRKKHYALPKVNTERFMTSYVSRLIFKRKIR